MPTLLVTGFGPWGPHAENASTLWWERAEVTPPAGWKLRRLTLPVDWEEAPRRLRAACEEADDLAVVLLCGLAAERQALTPERFAHNLADPLSEDVGGRRFPGETLTPGGPVAYAATLPVAALVEAFAAAGLPAAESRDAGAYLCNCLSYRLLEDLAARPGVRGGFLHVPPRGRLSDAQWQRAAEVVVEVLTG
jgi:pyroglutamyl-peptidase